MNRFRFLLLALGLLFSAVSLRAAHHEGMHEATPGTLMHVVTVSWKESATEEQIQAALDGVVTMAKELDGLERVWIKSIKAQGGKTHAFAMEFKNEAALEAYAGSDAHKAWYELYIPIRERSATFDIIN